ncbi:unnamed protein product [marine sediment metagenome]|uniref:Sodium:alanine symporter family protein n=1 Tax=marine sediment metagenome TaxID=412755 RepID=X1W2C3_9ZZZZ
MTAIMDLLGVIDNFVWGPPMMIILVGTGIFLTIRLGFPQFKHTTYALKLIFKGALKKDSSAKEEGEITPFQALTSTLAGYLQYLQI